MEGFGLTLESKALSWFQTLEPDTYSDFLALEKNFIAAFSKMGVSGTLRRDTAVQLSSKTLT